MISEKVEDEAYQLLATCMWGKGNILDLALGPRFKESTFLWSGSIPVTVKPAITDFTNWHGFNLGVIRVICGYR